MFAFLKNVGVTKDICLIGVLKLQLSQNLVMHMEQIEIFRIIETLTGNNDGHNPVNTFLKIRQFFSFFRFCRYYY